MSHYCLNYPERCCYWSSLSPQSCTLCHLCTFSLRLNATWIDSILSESHTVETELVSI